MTETEFIHLFNGRAYPPSEVPGILGSIHTSVLTPQLYEDRTICAFETAEAFEEWVEEEGLTRRLSQLRQAMGESADQERQVDERELEERALQTDTRLQSALRKFASEIGVPPDAPELFRRAVVELPEGHDPVFDPAILYENLYYGGRAVYLPGHIGDLRWLNFNDKATSAKVLGLGALCENIWYGGRRFWLLMGWHTGGLPYFEVPWLGWFNDLASSVFFLAPWT